MYYTTKLLYGKCTILPYCKCNILPYGKHTILPYDMVKFGSAKCAKCCLCKIKAFYSILPYYHMGNVAHTPAR